MMSEAQYVYLAVARAATVAEGRAAGGARARRHVYETVIARARPDDGLARAARAELHAATAFRHAKAAAAAASEAEHAAHCEATAADAALKGAHMRLAIAAATVERETEVLVAK